MVLQNFLLLKFIAKKEYVEDFLSGNLYMNSVDYFWGEYLIENAKNMKDEFVKSHPNIPEDEVLIRFRENIVDGQMDLFEGTVSTIDPKFLGDNGIFKTDISLRADGFRFCNLLCFYRLDYKKMGEFLYYETNDSMESFGKYVVVILDKDEFLKRIDQATNALGFKYLTGDVEYSESYRNGKRVFLKNHIVLKAPEEININENDCENYITSKRDIFHKEASFSYQKEWRVSLYRGIQDIKPFILEVGDIRDIAICCPVNKLIKVIDRAFKKGKVKFSRYGYSGNTTREEMRELFYALGDYKAVPFGIIGN